MSDYHDGPRGGIASYRGQPHIYESCWDGEDDSLFRLAPIDEATLRLALEDWRIQAGRAWGPGEELHGGDEGALAASRQAQVRA